jgi:streptogramin lyase
MKFIKNWITNDFTLPSGSNETHYHCLYCKADGYYYTRYTGGQLVKIDPKTWEAEIIYQTNSGIAYGMAFHPIRTSELWIGYEHGNGAELANSLCIVDVTNPAATFQKLTGATNGGHRDGRIDQAQFYRIRQMNFDADGNLFIGDSSNSCIRKVDTDNMMVETIIGIPGKADFKDGNKEEALFDQPHGIATDPDGIVYVSDFGNNRIRRIAIE